MFLEDMAELLLSMWLLIKRLEDQEDLDSCILSAKMMLVKLKKRQMEWSLMAVEFVWTFLLQPELTLQLLESMLEDHIVMTIVNLARIDVTREAAAIDVITAVDTIAALRLLITADAVRLLHIIETAIEIDLHTVNVAIR